MMNSATMSRDSWAGRNIKTPNLDRMAAEGMRLQQPVRRLVGLRAHALLFPDRQAQRPHLGALQWRRHAAARGRATIASLLKPLGYATGGFGKWGCGGRDSTGVPEKHGFDVFLGYYDQVHAHSYYPPYLIRNSEEVPLAGNSGSARQDLLAIRHPRRRDATSSANTANSRSSPTCRTRRRTATSTFRTPIPPGRSTRTSRGREPARRYAAMVTMVDRQVGEILALLKELGIDDNTLVFFSGDNGGNDYFTSAEHPRGVHLAQQASPDRASSFAGRRGRSTRAACACRSWRAGRARSRPAA